MTKTAKEFVPEQYTDHNRGEVRSVKPTDDGFETVVKFKQSKVMNHVLVCNDCNEVRFEEEKMMEHLEQCDL